MQFITSKHRSMRAQLLISAVGAWPSLSVTQAARPAEFVPDLEAQFAALSVRADPLGLHISTTPNPSSCKHYQAIVRVQGADGTPFMLMTRSGNTPSFGYVPDGWVCDDSPSETGYGNLIVFRMGSRDKDGERLRSNRLRPGVHVNNTPPEPEDVATKFYTTTQNGLVFRNGTEEKPPGSVYRHPGGMQVVGNILAVALETPASVNSPVSMVMFIDVTDPESPVVKSQYHPVDVDQNPIATVGTMGVARMPDGHYLMAITGGANNTVVHFFRSKTTDLASTELDWVPVDRWIANVNSEIVAGLCELALPGSTFNSAKRCLSPDEQYLEQNWPEGNDLFTHQTLQFLREGDVNGTLYLAGIRGRFLSDDSHIDLYRVDCDTPNCEGGEIRLKRRITKELSPYPITGGNKLASFAAATSFYISPSGELIMYAAEHDNDGPGGTVKAGEWRHGRVVRPDSPTLKPTAWIEAPSAVDEGSSIALAGSASAPITKAFLQLFHDTTFRSFNLVADYADRDRDDFFNLYLYELQVLPFFQHSDKARSWIWHAPGARSGPSTAYWTTVTSSAPNGRHSPSCRWRCRP